MTMPEITIIGENTITGAWGWEIALYLFLGGLVAGLMVFSGVMRLTRPGRFNRALIVADTASLPLLAAGLLCLFLDLSNKLNFWRFYTTFQVQSAMSWGAWILLVTMVILMLRFASRIPAPGHAVLLRLQLFPSQPGGEIVHGSNARRSPAARFIEWAWVLLTQIGKWAGKRDRALTVAGIVFGVGLGFYTGVLLSSMPFHPLWNTVILAPLFLTSGLAGGGAFLALFLPKKERMPLVPVSIVFCGVELLLLFAFALNLTGGSQAAQRAVSLLFSGGIGWAFWGLVILLGLVLPAVLEQLERMHVRLPLIHARVPSIFKLAGGLALRFVIVYAGMLSVM